MRGIDGRVVLPVSVHRIGTLAPQVNVASDELDEDVLLPGLLGDRG